MANGQYIAMSAAVAHGTQLEVISNNLANLNTTGYKQLRTTFDQFLITAKGETTKGFTALSSMETDLTAGVLKETGNPLDVALSGDGFFMVQTPQGDRLTRAGSFRVASDGVLRNANGHPVLSSADQGARAPIQLSPNAPVSISEAGDVEQAGTIIARLSVVRSTAEKLTPMGDATYDAPADTLIEIPTPDLSTGFLETSNVNAIRGMVDLIETTRAFESSQRIMRQYQRIDRQTLDIV